MTLFRGLAALLLLALGACTTTQDPPKGPSFYVMRHLQKAEGQDPPLSDEGRANARRLIGFLAAEPVRVIYVSTTRRAFETAAPAARSLRAKVRRLSASHERWLKHRRPWHASTASPRSLFRQPARRPS